MAERSALVFNVNDAPTWTMRWDRGTRIKLFDEENTPGNVDVHLSVLKVDSGPGPYHYHARAENIYIVLEGTFEVVVEGKRYYLRPGDVAYIPPGLRHYAGTSGDTPAKAIEIYVPAGDDFHIVDPPAEIVDVERPAADSTGRPAR